MSSGLKSNNNSDIFKPNVNSKTKSVITQKTQQEIDEQEANEVVDLKIQLSKKVSKLIDRYKTIRIANNHNRGKNSSHAMGLLVLYELLEDEIVKIADESWYQEELMEYMKLLVRLKDYNLVAGIEYMAKHKTDIFDDEFYGWSRKFMDKGYDEMAAKFPLKNKNG